MLLSFGVQWWTPCWVKHPPTTHKRVFTVEPEWTEKEKLDEWIAFQRLVTVTRNLECAFATKITAREVWERIEKDLCNGPSRGDPDTPRGGGDKNTVEASAKRHKAEHFFVPPIRGATVSSGAAGSSPDSSVSDEDLRRIPSHSKGGASSSDRQAGPMWVPSPEQRECAST